jgi:sugar lactone lactonase YvrE
MVIAGVAHAGIFDGNANLVLGQATFAAALQSGGRSGLFAPAAIAVDKTRDRVFVTDTYNNRILWWNGISNFTNGMPADGVIGQSGFDATLPNRGNSTPDKNTLYHPSSVCLDPNGNMWVADTDNNRVLSFLTATELATGMDAVLVLGQYDYVSREPMAVKADALNRPTGVSLDPSWNIWVADAGNNRVLRYLADSGYHYHSGQGADIALGQPDFGSNDPHAGTITAATLNSPQAIYADAAGNLWVADTLNNRVLRYSAPFVSGAAGISAGLVLGQPDFVHNAVTAVAATALNGPAGIEVDASGDIWVSDRGDHRLLRYSGQLTNGAAAVQVIGQAGFTAYLANAGGSPGSGTLSAPADVTVDGSGNLWVADAGNNRVLKFSAMKVQGVEVPAISNTAPRTITVTGEGMTAGISMRLVRAGQPDIVATAVTLSGDTRLSGVFDVTGAAAGTRDLVLVSGGAAITLPAAVTILATTITAVTPSRVLNTGPAEVVITGGNIEEGTLPQLTRTGFPAVNGSVVSRTAAELRCVFDVTDLRPGVWDVVLSSNGVQAILSGAFSLHFPAIATRHLLPSSSYFFGIETGQGEAALEVPAFTFSEDITLTVADPDNSPDITQPEFRTCGFDVSITADRELEQTKEIIMIATYNSAYADGHDRSRLVFVCWDPLHAWWSQVRSLASVADPVVACSFRHLSLFRLVERMPAADLRQVTVYPNPYRPGSAGMQGDGILGRGVVFSGLTGRATVRIFTIAGELAAELTQENGTGVLIWDTATDQGDKAASGVYLYVIDSPSTREEIKGRFSIIR